MVDTLPANTRNQLPFPYVARTWVFGRGAQHGQFFGGLVGNVVKQVGTQKENRATPHKHTNSAPAPLMANNAAG